MKFMELSDKEILDIVTPLAEHTENSWNQKSHLNFCKYLINVPGNEFPEAEFNRQIEEGYDEYGLHTISSLVAIHQNPDNVIVIWKVSFEKRLEPGLLIYEFKEHEGQVRICACTYHA